MAANTGCTLNVGSDGNIHANRTIGLSGQAQLMGDAATVTTTIKDEHGGIKGDPITEAQPVLYPVETCPDYTESIPGSPYYTKPDFTIGKGATYKMPPGTYSFRDFEVTGNATVIIDIPDDSPVKTVTIYLSGELDIGGQGGPNPTPTIANTERNAAALSFVACNRGAEPNIVPWKLAGGTDAYFTVYAPNNNVDLAGGSSVFGAIVGNVFTATGGAQVHYDVALGVVNDPSAQQVSAIMPRSWRQLLR